MQRFFVTYPFKLFVCRVLWILLTSLGLVGPQLTFALDRISVLEQTQMPNLHLPKIEQRSFANGLQLLLEKNSEVPVVRGYLFVRVGSIYEPSDQLGLAGITGALLREGGAGQRSPQEIDALLANIGAEISSEIGGDYGLLTFHCLKEDLPKVLELLFEILRKPLFGQERLDLLKVKSIEAIKRQNDQASQIAKREFPKLVYGKDSVYARSPDIQHIENITRQDVLSFHQTFYFPDRMILALSGDFSTPKLLKLLQKLSGTWGKSTQAMPKIADLEKTWKAQTLLIPKKADQATVILGHFGERRSNPDKYALLLLNQILGGDTLTSRLGSRIRSELGLVYGVYSDFGFENDYGLFFVSAQTKAKNTKKVLGEIKQILNEIRTSNVINQEELDYHKMSLLNALYAQYEPSYNYAKMEARYKYYGYPPHYLQIFAGKIQEVSLQDIERVAKIYLRPKFLKILVVGDPKEIAVPASYFRLED